MNFKPLRSSYPVGHLLNPSTPYRNSVQTDVRATWAKWTPLTRRVALEKMAPKK